MGTYYKFKELFDKYSKEAGKEQFLIPYFISAHPGTTDEDMVNLALWLKQNGFRLDQVQNFYPSPLANATTMYYTELDPLHKVDYKSEKMFVAKGEIRRRFHKAVLRYHDPANWPKLREEFLARGWGHLIGKGPGCLVPEESKTPSRQRRLESLQKSGQIALTRHLPMDQQKRSSAEGGKSKPTTHARPGSNKKPVLAKPVNGKPATKAAPAGKKSGGGSASGKRQQAGGSRAR